MKTRAWRPNIHTRVKNPPLDPAGGRTSETLTGPESRLVNFFPDIRVILSVASLPTLIEITH